MGERTIDDLLNELDISHTREPPYPEGKFRGDFLVGTTIIEYLGLIGSADYDAKTRKKKQICVDHGIPLLLIKPSDIADIPALTTQLKDLVKLEA